MLCKSSESCLHNFIFTRTFLLQKKYDFIISTVNDFENENHINISPLLLEQDLVKLNAKLEKLKERRNRHEIRSELSKYIDKNLFFHNVNFDCKKDALLYLCNQMIRYGNAKTDFVDSVFEREKLSSTAFFNKFAVPHAMHFGDVKTRITFLINEKPIPWTDEMQINIIMLISINQKDSLSFNRIYSAIVSLLLDDKSFAEVLEVQTYDELLEYLKSHINSSMTVSGS